MIEPKSYYQEKILNFQKEVKTLYKKLLTFSTLRVITFLLTLVGIYLTYENTILVTSISVMGIGVFLILLSRYTDIKKKHALYQALLEINEVETEVLEGKYHHLPTGFEYKNPDHFFSEDIDLFGIGSFFQYLNRTKTIAGSVKLKNNLLANDVHNIIPRQDSIKELSTMPDWNQRFLANASLIKVETSSDKIENWLITYQPFWNSKLKLLPFGFSTITVAISLLAYFDIISASFLMYWFFLGLFIIGRYVKKVNELSRESDMARDTIKQYSLLLQQIETAKFQSKLLFDNQARLFKTNKKASKLFEQFSSALDNLDNRNNFIYAIFANGLFLADIFNTIRVEKWIVKHKGLISEWFEVVAFFDSQISLGTFAFNHPTYSYPLLNAEQYIIIKATDLGHPLLRTAKRVDNDIVIKPQEFFIITGANMAGKSTFLRTVSLHIVMANTGLPVCATASIYSPVKLITSMRTSDSLKDESSYFFSELSRLKFIVDAIKTEPYFIILDEILKGTNSTDKAIGSKKFVQKLVKGNATGLIATHDLSLCAIATDLDDVKNYYFDAQIIEDELYFDYTFKEGICQNMNASFLLKKMDII